MKESPLSGYFFFLLVTLSLSCNTWDLVTMLLLFFMFCFFRLEACGVLAP